MLSVLKNSLDHINSLLTPSLFILAGVAVSYCIHKGYWRKSALHMSLTTAMIFLIGWRCLVPLVSSRYFAILILPAIFLTAFLWGRTYYRKWAYSWLIMIAAVIMLGKDFRYTSEDYRYWEVAAAIREDRLQEQKSVFVTLSNDYNKYLYVLEDMGIDLLDLSLEDLDTRDSMLHVQLPLNYDRIYVAEKRKKMALEAPTNKEFDSILYQYSVGKNERREILVFRQSGNYSAISLAIKERLPFLSSEITGDFTELMLQKQREAIRERLVSQGFSEFQNKDFELPKNWIPEVYAGSTGKERVFATVESQSGLLVRTPQSLAMIYAKRLTITEDCYIVADVTAVTPVELQLGTHNYSLENKTLDESVIHGFQSAIPGRRQLIFFRLNAERVKAKSIQLRCIVAGGEVKIHHLYLFPCRLIPMP